jgi:hypothetical protein
MNRTAKNLFIATLCLFTAAPAFAGHRHDRLLDRLDRQQNRIERGIDSGELTRREARTLKKQQRRIHRLAREFYADDHLCKRERRILHKKLNRASDRIYALKHNDEYRYARYGRGYRHRERNNLSYWVE